jgi:hypothetical protein
MVNFTTWVTVYQGFSSTQTPTALIAEMETTQQKSVEFLEANKNSLFLSWKKVLLQVSNNVNLWRFCGYAWVLVVLPNNENAVIDRVTASNNVDDCDRYQSYEVVI